MNKKNMNRNLKYHQNEKRVSDNYYKEGKPEEDNSYNKKRIEMKAEKNENIEREEEKKWKRDN